MIGALLLNTLYAEPDTAQNGTDVTISRNSIISLTLSRPTKKA